MLRRSASRERADQISPASLMRPPEPSTRSTTTACLPLRASTPVTVPGELARLRAAMGRTTAINAIRDLPPEDKAIWREQFDHYVFDNDATVTDHIPETARSILAPLTSETAGRLRAFLLRALSK